MNFIEQEFARRRGSDGMQSSPLISAARMRLNEIGNN